MKSNQKIILLLLAALVFFSCSGGEMEDTQNIFKKISDVPDEYLNALSRKQIFFGHQSVGYNIVEGIENVMENKTRIKLNISQDKRIENISEGVLIHSEVGQNKNPKSKIDAFEKILDSGLGKNVDVAFLKFCYVDITTDTDVEKVFTIYRETMQRLKNKYPETTFVHFTVPLTTIPSEFKVWLKKILGKSNTRDFDANIKRHHYNSLLLDKYKGKDLVFDLAGIESTNQNGSMQTFIKDTNTYHSLVPEYTYDGGHLNETGKKVVGEQLLIFLANID